jgi:hypothetical protein
MDLGKPLREEPLQVPDREVLPATEPAEPTSHPDRTEPAQTPREPEKVPG